MPQPDQPSYEELAAQNAELTARIAELLAVVAEQTAMIEKLRAEVAALRRLVGWPGGIAPPGSHRTEREPLGSLRSSHRNPASSRAQAQWANSRGSRSVTPAHHRMNLL